MTAVTSGRRGRRDGRVHRLPGRPELEQRPASGVVRRLAGFIRPYTALIVGMTFLSVVDAVLGIAPALLARRLVDDGVLGHRPGLVAGLAVAIAAVAVASGLVGYVQRHCAALCGTGERAVSPRSEDDGVHSGRTSGTPARRRPTTS